MLRAPALPLTHQQMNVLRLNERIFSIEAGTSSINTSTTRASQVRGTSGLGISRYPCFANWLMTQIG